jgi:hypothetical protein
LVPRRAGTSLQGVLIGSARSFIGNATPVAGESSFVGIEAVNPRYCKFAIRLSSADFGGRVSDSGSVPNGSSTMFN